MQELSLPEYVVTAVLGSERRLYLSSNGYCVAMNLLSEWRSEETNWSLSLTPEVKPFNSIRVAESVCAICAQCFPDLTDFAVQEVSQREPTEVWFEIQAPASAEELLEQLSLEDPDAVLGF